MAKIWIAAAFLALLCTAAQAAPPVVATQQVRAQAHDYWLHDGLNRLVFWRPAGASHANAAPLKSDAR